MARSKTSLINIALNLIGDKSRIANDTDASSEPARVAQLFYDEVLDQVLAEPLVEWVCARTRAQLTLLATTPAFGWSYQYTVPADCLRVIAAVASSGDTRGIPWRRESNKLLLDDNECYILYIKRITDVTQFSPHLAEAFCTKLASVLATRLAGNKVKAQELLGIYINDVLPKAIESNQAEVYVEDEEGHTNFEDAGR